MNDHLPVSDVGSRHAASVCLLALLWLGLASCGSVGDPLPPLLNIPAASADLTARQIESTVVLEWTRPLHTTEGTNINDLDRFLVWGMDLEGSEPPPLAVFEQQRQAFAEMQGAGVEAIEPGERITLRLVPDLTAREVVRAMQGKRIAFAVESQSSRGRSAGISNFAVIEVVEPPARPAAPELKVEADAIVIAWAAVEGAAAYRLLRAESAEGPFNDIAKSDHPNYRDTAFEWGRQYHYAIGGIARSSTGEALGALSPSAAVTPTDVFPPSIPKGLTAIAATESVELSWDPNPEEDLAGYRLYRAVEGGEPALLGDDLVTSAAYSDRDAPDAGTLRYTVAAVDRKGNESAASEAIEVRK